MEHKKYYAVLAGDRTGVYKDLKTCMSAMSGHPGAQYHEFADPDSAAEWLAQFENDEPAQPPARFLGPPRPRIDGNVVDIRDIIPVTAEIFASGVSHGTKAGCAALIFMEGNCLQYVDHTEYDTKDPALAAAAGELLAIRGAASYCASEHMPAIRVYPGDEWPERLARGTGSAKLPPFMKNYADAMSKLKDDVLVIFHEPVGQADDARMDAAANLAKAALMDAAGGKR